MVLLGDKKKPFYKSKTFWFNAVVGLAGVFIPGAQVWIASNPALFSILMSTSNMILRTLTKEPIKIKD